MSRIAEKEMFEATADCIFAIRKITLRATNFRPSFDGFKFQHYAFSSPILHSIFLFPLQCNITSFKRL